MNSERLGALTDYVAALNLQQDPFRNTLDNHFFYADPGLMQRLDLLQHLTQFGDQLLLIAGPEGSGKSTLLSQFKLRAKDSWRICHLDGGKYASASHLLHDMADFFNTPYGDDSAMMGRELIQHARSLQQDAGLAVIVIDDADRLGDDSLSSLLNLGESPQEALRYLRIILLGDPSLDARLMTLGLNNPRNPIAHRLDMQPFDTQQSAAYLMYRLAIAGYSGDSPFSSTEVEAMHKAAGGLPGQLNIYARETLSETIERKLAAKKTAAEKPAKPRPTESAGFMPSNIKLPLPAPVLGAGAVVLVVAIAWFSGLFDQDEGLPVDLETQALTLPPEIQPIDTEGAQPDTDDSAVTPIVRTPPEKRVKEAVEPVITVKKPQPKQPEPTPATAAPQEPAPAETQLSQLEAAPAEATAAPTPEPAEKPAPDAAVSALQSAVDQELAKLDTVAAAPAPSNAEVEPPKPAPAAPPASTLPAWVAAAADDHYTLQLVGLSQKSSAETYLKDHRLDDKAAIIVSERKGAPWYSVIYGDFPDKASAQSATLPASLKATKPWPRTFAAVREAAKP